MQRTVWKSSSHLVVLFIILVITTACLGTPAQTAVPTLAAVANLPVGGETAVVVTNNVVLPGTFTPEPQTTAVQNNLSAAVPRALNSEPSATPYIPTNTPRPTWGPPTRTPLPTPTFTPSPTSVFAAGAAYRGNPVFAAGGYPPVTSGSKLSIHVIRSNRKVMDFVRAARPAVIKSVGDLGFLTEVKKISPDTMTIGRIDQLSQNYDGNPEEAARQFVAKQLEQYRLNPGVDYWEGWNEPNPTMANMGWYARFEQERVR
ncbi:MAG: hypothetical protein KC421_26405, partial [Anaerolineales bacterium]|nr:hypothetical protein [Anaerolineales bacterium]